MSVVFFPASQLGSFSFKIGKIIHLNFGIGNGTVYRYQLYKEKKNTGMERIDIHGLIIMNTLFTFIDAFMKQADLESRVSPAKVSTVTASTQMRKMVALYDYDPQELSPNVDAEVKT